MAQIMAEAVWHASVAPGFPSKRRRQLGKRTFAARLTGSSFPRSGHGLKLHGAGTRHIDPAQTSAAIQSSGTPGSFLAVRMVSEVLTLATLGAGVSLLVRNSWKL